MKTEITFIAACFLLITQLVVITARPRFNRRAVRMKRKTMEETPIVVLTRTVPTKESPIDEESNRRVLEKLLGLDDVDTRARKYELDAFNTDLAELSYELKFQSDDNMAKKTSQGKRRVRRNRCYPPHWRCSVQPTSSSRKQVLPHRDNKNL